MLLGPLVRRTWSPRGRTPVLYQRGRHHKKVSAIAALAVSPERDRVRLYFRLHSNADIQAAHVICFLRNLDRELHDPWILIWDRLNAHRANLTTRWVAATRSLRTVFLPPYAPELNPVEYVWQYLKMNPLANLALAETEQLARVTYGYACSLQRKQALLRSFIRPSPLFLRLR